MNGSQNLVTISNCDFRLWRAVPPTRVFFRLLNHIDRHKGPIWSPKGGHSLATSSTDECGVSLKDDNKNSPCLIHNAGAKFGVSARMFWSRPYNTLQDANATEIKICNYSPTRKILKNNA